jgi:hypothetical protein
MGLLQTIAWKTRRWNLQINILDIYLHDSERCWGFNLIQIRNNYVCSCLLAFEFRFPNGADIKRFTIDNFDILFLGAPSRAWMDNLDDARTYGHKSTRAQNILYKFLHFVF